MINKILFTVVPLPSYKPSVVIIIGVHCSHNFSLPSFLWTNRYFFQELQSLCYRPINTIFHIFNYIFFFWWTPRDIHPRAPVLFCTVFFLVSYPAIILNITFDGHLCGCPFCWMWYLLSHPSYILFFAQKYSNTIPRKGYNKLISKFQHIWNIQSAPLIVCLGKEYYFENIFF